MPNFVLFGAPGAGKGTLAGKIKSFSPVVHISTGDLFRANIKGNTPIGKEAKSFIDSGRLVPDSVVIDMVKDRIAQDDVKKNGFMLDGFPRTLDQAKALSKIAKLDVVVVIDIPKEDLKKRILGRWSCPKCGKIYNIYNDDLKPKVEGKCDVCADTELTHRSDDNEETFEKRWNTYLSQSEEVINYYNETPGLVKKIDGRKTMSYTEEELKKILNIE
ncbi:MAG: adenylate kinase family protein [Promethearchaeota archaeon]